MPAAMRDPDLWDCALQVAIKLRTAGRDHPQNTLADTVYDLMERGIIEIGPHLNRRVKLRERAELLK